MRIIFLILTASIALFWVKPVFASNVLLNEIMANPQSGESEWIEIFNNSASGVNTEGWYVQEKTASGTFNSYTLPSVNLSALSLCYYEFSGSKLNNDGDTVNLLDSQNIQHDTYSYTNTTQGKTFSRVPDGETWTTGATQTKSTTACSSLASASTSPAPSSSPSPISSSTSSTSFTISNVPSQIDSTESFSVSVNLSLTNNPNTTFYLKGAFKKADSSNYFGLTRVSGSWIKNNKTYSDQYKITTDSSGSWTGSLEIQPDILDSGYEGSGDYMFKVGRYTDSGSLSWSNEVTIKINAQEVVIEDEKKEEILGAKVSGGKAVKQKSSNDEELSLEKYIKVASPASVAAQVTPQPEVKGEKQTNYLSWIGGFMVISGIGVFAYVYLRNRSLREAIFNIFRKRD